MVELRPVALVMGVRRGGPRPGGGPGVGASSAGVAVAYKVSISDVETASSRLTIDINDDVVQVLRGWRKVRTEERAGVEPAGDDLVFVKADGPRCTRGSSANPRPLRGPHRHPGDLAARPPVPRLRHVAARVRLLLNSVVHVKVVSNPGGPRSGCSTRDELHLTLLVP
jgi:hypothetical protein